MQVTSTLPLAGVTVFEFGHSVAAPFAGSILAQLGADVIKVEKPGQGDAARDWGPPYYDETAVVFESLNRDKRGITVDLKDKASVERLIDRIIDTGDVVIQNFRAGSMDRVGLGADELTQKKPSLIYCNLSAFGSVGPLAAKPGYDPLMQAYGGLMSVTGEEGRPPVRIGVSLIDMGTGMWSVIAVLAALAERAKTGVGGVIDTSLYETAVSWMTLPLTGYLASGQVPRRLGSASGPIVPYQVFDTEDGCLMIGVGNDGLFRNFAAALGKPEWYEDERYSTNGQRVLNRDSLVSQITSIMASEPSAVWVEKLDAAGVPNAMIQAADGVANDPQTLALNIIQALPDTSQRLVGLPVSFDGVRPPLRNLAPSLGGDNDLMDDAD